MRILRFLLLASMALWPVGAAHADAAADLQANWHAAVEAYKSRDFERSARLFEALADGGMRSADLFFNLGNAYAEMGQRGRAVWMYEKALALSPRHGDARRNLGLLRSEASESHHDPGGAFILIPFFWLSGRLSAAEWMVLLSIAYFLAALSLCGRLLARGSRLRRGFAIAAGIGLFCMALTGVFALPKAFLEARHAHAVVLEPGIVVRSGPGYQEPSYFEVREGERLQVQAAPVRGWVRVRRPFDGRTGFLPETAIGEI